MALDFDNKIRARFAEYDPQRARAVVEALVALSLDAERQRAARRRAQSGEEVEQKSLTSPPGVVG